MRKYALLLVAVMAALLAKAQKFTYGADLGPNFSGAIIHTDTHATGTPGVGFQLGGFVELPFTDALSLRPRLLLSYERYVPHMYGDEYPIHVTFLKLPVDVVLRPSSLPKWFFGAGPYLAAGLSGAYSSKGNGFKSSIGFGSDADNDEAKRFDAGIDLVAGYMIRDNIILTANFDFGIVNYVNTAYFTASSAHTLNLGITAGYLLSSLVKSKGH
jgi:hypothetical protein